MEQSVKFDKDNINYRLISNIMFEGKGVDIFIVSADYDGEPMTDEEIEELYEACPAFAQEAAFGN